MTGGAVGRDERGHDAIAADRGRERKGWDSNATGRNAAAEPGGTAVLYR